MLLLPSTLATLLTISSFALVKLPKNAGTLTYRPSATSAPVRISVRPTDFGPSFSTIHGLILPIRSHVLCERESPEGSFAQLGTMENEGIKVVSWIGIVDPSGHCPLSSQLEHLKSAGAIAVAVVQGGSTESESEAGREAGRRASATAKLLFAFADLFSASPSAPAFPEPFSPGLNIPVVAIARKDYKRLLDDSARVSFQYTPDSYKSESLLNLLHEYLKSLFYCIFFGSSRLSAVSKQSTAFDLLSAELASTSLHSSYCLTGIIIIFPILLSLLLYAVQSLEMWLTVWKRESRKWMKRVNLSLKEVILSDQDISFRKTSGTDVCAICRDVYSSGDVVGQLGCTHEFHQECVHRWLHHSVNQSCPLCCQNVYTTTYSHNMTKKRAFLWIF